jgi:hypothetical protein
MIYFRLGFGFILILLNTSLRADLNIQPEYGYPECHRCYEQQQWCYDIDGENCTENILPCVKSQCTHYKRPLERWYGL